MTTPSFRHEPLDHTQPSIRVLMVSRFSSKTGLIQCDIKHTTIVSEYTCLSYRWGEPNDGGGPFDILVNDKIYQVRQNLYQFLQRAKDRSLGWLWIDALCIDQDNTTERSHQVQHMGRIYSRAKKVLAWLGDTSDVWLGDTSDVRWSTSSRYVPSGENSISTILLMARSYWQRAWVTQEIFLAQYVEFMAGAVFVPARILRNLVHRSSMQELESLIQLFDISMKHKVADFTDKTLFQLLEQMQYKQCLFPRDRIYSLLALCKESRSMLVDYDQSDAAFLSDTLRRFDVSCLCMARLLDECVAHPLDSSQGRQRDIHPQKLSEKLIVEMRLIPISIKTFRTTDNMLHQCLYCHFNLGQYILGEYHVFCLQTICANAPGHLYWMPSHSHVLQYQGPQYRLERDELQLIAPDWGLIYASNTGTEEHVLRLTLKGLADILHHGRRRSVYRSTLLDTTLCRNYKMGATGRSKSGLGGWSILDPSMSEQDGKLDG